MYIEECFMTEKVDRKLDCLGLYCPEPVFKTRLAIDELEIGETLEVVADDPAAESDINSLVKHLEQQIVSSTKEGDRVRILIRKIK
jgi:tRNA 2-thiouridine synthesizing protein A